MVLEPLNLHLSLSSCPYCCLTPSKLHNVSVPDEWKQGEMLSCVWPFETPRTVTHQSREFSRQDYWHGEPFPSPGALPNPGIKPRSPALLADSFPPVTREAQKVLVTKSCLALCNLMDCGPPGSSVHGILQARILEWGAIPFSRGSSPPRIELRFPPLQADSLPSEPAEKPCVKSI